LDEIEFIEISNIYYGMVKSILEEDVFISIKNEYEKKSIRFMQFIDKGYKIKGGTLGRGELKYSRNIIYGWFLERLILEIISKNKDIKDINFFGDDGNHDFFINSKNQIEIKGEKTTVPDFLIEFNNGKKLLMELKSAAKEVFTIKKGNVKALSKSAAFEKIPTSIIMIDLANKTYEIKNLKYFINLQPFVNQRMEGQLCYDFPRPTKSIENLKNEDISRYVNNDIFDFEIVKKYIVLAKASSNKPKKGKMAKLKKYVTIINKKIRVEELNEELIISQADFNNRINDIIVKYPEVKKSWNEIDKELNKLLDV
jgi:hypothetical protein